LVSFSVSGTVVRVSGRQCRGGQRDRYFYRTEKLPYTRTPLYIRI